MMKLTKLGMLLFSLAFFGCTEQPRSQFESLNSPAPELLDKIQLIIQPSVDFVTSNQKYAFENGVELTDEEKIIAKEIGVKHIDKIRLMYVDVFPFPKNKALTALARSHSFDSPELAGVTYGHGVYIRRGHKFILPHELIHVRQFEEMGIESFMRRYLLELTVMGYRAAPLESQAYNEAKHYTLSP